jgi:hypothetical protein
MNVIPREDRSTKPEKLGLLACIPLPCQFWKTLCLSVLRRFEMPSNEYTFKEEGFQLL